MASYFSLDLNSFYVVPGTVHRNARVPLIATSPGFEAAHILKGNLVLTCLLVGDHGVTP